MGSGFTGCGRAVLTALVLAAGGMMPAVSGAAEAPEFLAVLRAMGEPGSATAIGIDASSPQEALLARASGFLPAEISLTATNMSDADFATILGEDMRVNVDLVTQVRRLGRLAPGRRIGLRINPRCGHVNDRVDDSILYGGEKPSKFGVYEEDFPAAVAAAAEHGLTIDTVHVHVFNGILNADLPAVDRALVRIAGCIQRLVDLGCPIEEINIGGGIGVPWHPEDHRLDLNAWAVLLLRHLRAFDAVIACEPGEYASIQAGLLLAEVVTVEERLGRLFAGLDVGWNVCPHRFVYGLDMEAIHCTRADEPPVRTVTFSGNINEGPDLFVEDLPFPAVAEGDIVALYPAGAYTTTTYHPHCLRPPAKELYLGDRLPQAGIPEAPAPAARDEAAAPKSA